jgi:hypothetical protein
MCQNLGQLSPPAPPPSRRPWSNMPLQCLASSLCQINTTFSSLYVFRLQHPSEPHCWIVPIEKLKTLVALERNQKHKFKKNLKVTRDLRVNSSWATWQGNISTKRFSLPQIILYLMSTFKLFLNLWFLFWSWMLSEAFFFWSAANVFNFSIGTILQWNYSWIR